MADFEIAIAHKLITATAYMYFTIVSERSSARVSLKKNTSRHAFSAKRALATDDSAGDLPNPWDTAMHIMSVCATPTAWLMSEYSPMNDCKTTPMHEPLRVRKQSHQDPVKPCS
jgi:hypothetical protein